MKKKSWKKGIPVKVVAGIAAVVMGAVVGTVIYRARH